MLNRNLTAERVERTTESVLRDLRQHAQTHPMYASKLRERGYELDEQSLRERASRRAFSGLRFWRQWVPALAEKDLDRSVRGILLALTHLKDIIVEDKS